MRVIPSCLIGRRIGGRVLTLSAAVSMAAVAMGEISKDVIVISAENQSGSATYTLALDDTGWGDTQDPNGVYQWERSESWSMIDPDNGAVIAEIESLGVLYRNDPQINLEFAFKAGTSETFFSVTSAKLSFEDLPDAVGSATVSLSLTDVNDDGAYVKGESGPSANRVYWAAFNGDFPVVDTFSTLIDGVIVEGEGGTTTYGESDPEFGHRAIGKIVNNMSARLEFSLSGGDFVSGTSGYDVIPEPGTLLLALAGLVAVRRARR